MFFEGSDTNTTVWFHLSCKRECVVSPGVIGQISGGNWKTGNCKQIVASRVSICYVSSLFFLRYIRMYLLYIVCKHDKSCVEVYGPSSLSSWFVSISGAIMSQVKRCGDFYLFCLPEKCVLSKRDHHFVACKSSP